MLLALGAETDDREQEHLYNPLMLALVAADEGTALLLLHRGGCGADKQARCGRTPMYFACER
jgi:hypothetical protein